MTFVGRTNACCTLEVWVADTALEFDQTFRQQQSRLRVTWLHRFFMPNGSDGGGGHREQVLTTLEEKEPENGRTMHKSIRQRLLYAYG